MELVAGFAAQGLYVFHQDAALAAPAEPLAQRSLAWEHHPVSYPEPAAVDIQIQATKKRNKARMNNTPTNETENKFDMFIKRQDYKLNIELLRNFQSLVTNSEKMKQNTYYCYSL